ncbi:MAG: PLD nuclease N-terminal domain-containing protein [Candidatus Omnitrophica bacterium]|nr:PLD nuclease N-terminal domain-containing protein [Candidatus Omnitrophota bacterium]
MVGIPGLLGLLILVLDIIAIVSALQSSMDTGQKALWIVLILLLPVIGMVLYFLLGKKPNSLQE